MSEIDAEQRGNDVLSGKDELRRHASSSSRFKSSSGERRSSSYASDSSATLDQLVEDVRASKSSGSKSDVNKKIAALLKNQVKVTEDFSKAMKEKLARKETKILELKGEVSDLKRKLSGMEKGLTGTSGEKTKRMAELESELSKTRRQLEREQNRKLLSIPEEGNVKRSSPWGFLFSLAFGFAFLFAASPNLSGAVGVPANHTVLTPVRQFLGIEIDSAGHQHQLATATAGLTTCTEANTDLRVELNGWAVKYDKLALEKSSFQESSKRFEGAKNSCSHSLEQSQQQVQTLQREIGICRASQMAITERNRYTTEIQQCTDSLNQVSIKVSKLERSLGNCNESLESSTKTTAKLKADASTCADALSDADQNVRKLSREVGYLHDLQSNEIDKQVLKLKNQVSECSDKVETSETALRKLNVDVEDLTLSKHRMQSLLRECTQSLDEANKLVKKEKTRMIELRDRHTEDLEKVMQKSKALVGECTTSLDIANQQVKAFKVDLQRASSQGAVCTSDLETCNRNYKNLSNDLTTAVGEVATCKISSESQQRQLEEIQGDLQQRKRQIKDCTTALEENSSQMQNAKRAIEDSTEQIKSLKKSQAEVQASATELQKGLKECRENKSSDCDRRVKKFKDGADKVIKKVELLYQNEKTRCNKLSEQLVGIQKGDGSNSVECKEVASQLEDARVKLRKVEHLKTELENKLTSHAEDSSIHSTLSALSRTVSNLAQHDSSLVNGMFHKLQECQDQVKSCYSNSTHLEQAKTSCTQKMAACSADLHQQRRHLESLQAKATSCDASNSFSADLQQCKGTMTAQTSQLRACEGGKATCEAQVLRCKEENSSCSISLEQIKTERAQLLSSGAATQSQAQQMAVNLQNEVQQCEDQLKTLKRDVEAGYQNLTACQQASLQKTGEWKQEKTVLVEAQTKSNQLQQFIVSKLSSCQTQVKELEARTGAAQPGNSSQHSCRAVAQATAADCAQRIKALRANIDKIVLLEAGARKAYFQKVKDSNSQQVHCLEQLADVQDSLGDQQRNNSVLLQELKQLRDNGSYQSYARPQATAPTKMGMNDQQVEMLKTQVRKETQIAMEKEMASEKKLLADQKEELSQKLSELEIRSHHLKQEEARLGKSVGSDTDDVTATSSVDQNRYASQLQVYMENLQGFRKDLRETVFQTSTMADSQNLQVETRDWLNKVVAECNSRLAAATKQTEDILRQMQALRTTPVPGLTSTPGNHTSDLSVQSLADHFKTFKFQRWPMWQKAASLLGVVLVDVVLFQLLLPTDNAVCLVLTLVLHSFLVWQCVLASSWICTALFSCNVALGLVFLVKPKWALRLSCENGYFAITS